MYIQSEYYIHKLKEVLSLKQRQNPHYSLRAYARDLDMHPATLSQVINGNRPLPLKNAQSVVIKLNLGPKEKTLFLESFYQSKTSLDQIAVNFTEEKVMLDESHHKVLAEWEHYAVLTLFDLCDFQGTREEVIQHLNLTETRTDVVLTNLFAAGLLEKTADGKLAKNHKFVRTTEDISSVAIRESHKETLDMGKAKLDEVDMMLRDFSSTTLAIDLDKLTEAKTIIREFRQKMSALLRDGNKTDVYQLAIQFYPLTNPSLKESE
ncbi:hypothetical protein D3C72_1479190 [compost metagenome]